MQYFDALRGKWGEVHTLFIAAFIASFFLLFILIEPLLNSFFFQKEGVESLVIQTYLSRHSSDSVDKNQGQNLNNQALLSKNPQMNQQQQGALIAEKFSPPESVEMPPNRAAPANIPAPHNFAFGSAPNISNPNSNPLLGVGSGFRSKPNSPPGPKKNSGTASDQALENYRNQMGQEFESRQAQAELAQLMSSLEMNEQYQCTLRGNTQSQQKSKGAEGELIVRCSPASPKATFLEWIIKRIFVQELCANIAASASQGFQKKSCES